MKLNITNSKKGHLVLIGGNEDKNSRDSILKKTLELNSAKTVSVIPSASRYSYELGETYRDAFRYFGAKEVYSLNIKYNDEADRESYFEQISQSDMLFFTGGDQVRLVNILKGTKLLKLIKDKFSKGMTIAGTSAGAAAASNPMIFDGDGRGHIKGSVHYSEGFGLLKNITVDTHFTERNRLPRLLQFLSSGKSSLGLGLGEDTGLIIRPDDKSYVFGSGIVTIANARRKDFTDFDEISERMQYAVSGIKIGYLTVNSAFDIKKWKVITDWGI